jgi:branched-chain amino acid transport system permease protein
MGINTRRVQATSYAAAGALAGLAGFMVVPLTLAEPQLGTVLGLKAFAIAIIAGLSAPRGILLCGLVYGALEALISGYLYTGVRDILGFSLMILVLFIKPEGVFGKPVEERA